MRNVCVKVRGKQQKKPFYQCKKNNDEVCCVEYFNYLNYRINISYEKKRTA